MPHGPSGVSGTILITDSLAVFKQKDPAVQAAAQKLAAAMSSGDAQYDLDSSWGLTPILDYEKLGKTDVYYKADPWPVFVAGISTGGPEPMVEDFKSLQAVFTNMVQGIMLADGSVDELVTAAGEELAAVR